jgi:ABC-type transport system substrate-binding protein
MRSKKWLIAIGFQMGSTLALASTLTYVRPLPDLPQLIEPSQVDDLFTYALAFQMHGTLFRIQDNRVTSYLVASFEVPDPLTYRLRLRPLHFHDMSPLTSQEVIDSLERAIRNRVNNHEGFRALKGFDTFLEGRVRHLSGIEKTKDPQEVVFRLTKPDSELLTRLTDVRFSIWKTGTSPPIGIGPYQFRRKQGNEILLERFPQPELEPADAGPTLFKIQKMSFTEAVEKFTRGQVDDLFFYPVGSDLAARLNSVAHIHKVYFPRTYVLMLKSSRLKDLSERRRIFDSINVAEIVHRCFPGEVPTRSLMPEGYVGYVEDGSPAWSPSPNVRPSTKRKLKISIADSIGQEECLKSELTRQLSPISVPSVSIDPMVRSLKRWDSENIDGNLCYLEGETSVHYFGGFHSTNSHTLGDLSDKEFEPLFFNFMEEKNPEKKSKAAQQLARHILSRATVFPLFHRQAYIIYQKKYRDIGPQFSSMALTPLTSFELEEGKNAK